MKNLKWLSMVWTALTLSLGAADAAHELPGYVGAVAGRDGKVVFDVQGVADLATRRPMTPDTLFWAASNTKGVAAALMLTVVDEGKVSLDDPVEKYLPAFADFKVADQTVPGGVRPPKTRPTVRQVLSHTSGLAFFPSMPIDRWTVQELAKMAAEQPQPADPGTAYRYSNWGIDVAMAIVETVSGRPWNELLQARILDPLGMKDTTFFPTEDQLARLATAYRLKDGEAPQPILVDQFQQPYTLPTRRAEAGGGLFTTPRDFIRFLRMLAADGVAPDGKRILSEQAMAEWTRKQTPPGVWNNYSFGMGVNPKGRSLSHGGAYQTFGEANLRTGVARLYFVQFAGQTDASKRRARDWLKAHGTEVRVEGQQQPGKDRK